MKKLFIIIAAVTALFSTSACKKSELPELNLGTVTIEFDYEWGMDQSDFALNTPLLHPMSGDELTFTMFRHYVSNVSIQNSDGDWIVLPKTYHLLDLSDPSSLTFTFDSIPAGNYLGIRMLFGVDSTANVSGAQEGALDPANQMFWSWNSGYIMIKAEGTSPQSTAMGGAFQYHLGGFIGENKAITWGEYSFGSDKLVVDQDADAAVHMVANPARLFHTYGSVANGAMIHMPNANAGTMAQDFNGWTHVHDVH